MNSAQDQLSAISYQRSALRPLYLILCFCTITSSFLVTSYGLLVPITIYAADSLYYIHTDYLGSTTVVTDENGDAVSQHRHFPYGGDRISTDLERILTERGYTSQIQDRETNLYYFNARCYDPALGAFISADKVNDQINRYVYVSNNPVIFTDPSGHKIWSGYDENDPISKVQLPQPSSVYWAPYHSQLEAGPEYAIKACGPASLAMVAKLFLYEPLSVAQATNLMRQRVFETDWPAKPTSRGFVPGVGTNIYGIFNFALDFPELEPELFLDQDLKGVQTLLTEYQQPMIVTTHVNWDPCRGGHLAVLRGFEGDYASVYDPYLYKMDIEGSDLRLVGAYELLVPLDSFEAAFTGYALVLNTGELPMFDSSTGYYNHVYGIYQAELEMLR